MKLSHKNILLSIFVLLFSNNTFSQIKTIGSWAGFIKEAGLQVVFHFSQDDSGKFIATMDSPDQQVFGITLKNVFLSDDSVSAALPAAGILLTGKRAHADTIQAVFTQSRKYNLTLNRASSKSTVKEKPQTPVPPFDYLSEEVTFPSVEDNVQLSGTVTKPNDHKKYPAFILISGSGPQNRDEQIGLHKPFAVLADYLTKRGYIVLRYDDRGTGSSTGNFSASTSADFAKDAEGAIAYLSTRSDVDINKLGIIGHSEGGLIAPIVATNKNIAYLILLAAPGVKIMDVMAEQNIAYLNSLNIGEENAAAYGNLYKEIVRTIVYSKDTIGLNEKTAQVIERNFKNVDESMKIALNLNNPEKMRNMAAAFIKELRNPWMNYFLQYDPQPVLQQVKSHVLAINGEKDIQVIAEQNINGLKKSLVNARSVETKIIPGLNHLFQECNRCTVDEYLSIEQTFSPNALEIIGKWLDRVSQYN
jgi:alpha/beta superfamily hydrolase